LSTINKLYASLPDRAMPSRQIAELMEVAQSTSFFYLAAAKDARIAALKAHFARTGLRKVYLCAHLSGFDCSVEGFDIGVLQPTFFQEPDPHLRKANKLLLEGCIVIINSSVVGRVAPHAEFAEFFEDCTSTCFVAWDHDNHHWLEVSTFMAAHSDIYVPAHHENLYLLSRFNWLIAGPIYASTFQWSRKYLTDQLPQILLAERSDAPLGMHVGYTQFTFRRSVIASLNQYYPSIGFSGQDFHARTSGDRLVEWSSHKTHWIAPVLNDVPIRIFDALITGGIPIVPSSLRLLPPVNAIPHEHIVFASPADIVNPVALVAHANALFDKAGRDGMVARHRFALQHHHGNTSIEAMLRIAMTVLGLEVGSS
jgi:hypothetical protein